jgi:hypothetical protein
MPSPDTPDAAGSPPDGTSAAPAAETSIGKESGSPVKGGGSRAWTLMLVMGVLAGLISWAVEEVELRASDPVARFQRGKNVSFAKVGAELRQKLLEASTRTAMLSYGSLGGLLGLGLGLCGGRLRGSWPRGLAAGMVGLVVGGTAGAALSWELVPHYFKTVAADREKLEDDLTFPLMTHLGLWVSAGVAGGLALGLGIGSWSRGAKAIFGGVVGAALGTALYEFVGALAFPMAETNLPISKQLGARLLAHLAVAVLAAAGAWGAVGSLETDRDRPAEVVSGTTGSQVGRSAPA